MEQTQQTTSIDYLEQRYQEGQEKLAKLQQQVEAQEYRLQEQTRQLEDLEKELDQARAQLAQSPPLEAHLARFKDELLQLVERQYARREATPGDPGRAVMTQLDNHTKALHELRREIDKAQRYDEQITLARTEVERLNKMVSTFQAQIDHLKEQLNERTRSVTYLEEQRRADTRHLAELQAELPPLQKKVEANLAKIQLVERQIPQFGKYEIALEELRNEIRHFMERTDFQIAERERQMKKYTDLAQVQESRIEEYKGLMEKYAEHYQLNKRALASLQDFQERLQREQHQAQELQRLAEERQWASIEKWQIDYEQRWKKQSTEWQPKLADLQKNLELQQKRIDQFSKLNQTIEKQLALIFQIIEEDVHFRALTGQEWQKRFEEIASRQD
ncbi:MAG: hypothetical protein AB1801_15770 [Chloroflexota bacterium]